MAATDSSEGQDASKATSKRSGSSPTEAEERSREGSTSGKSASIRETESSEIVVNWPSSKSADKGSTSSQSGRSNGTQRVLLKHLKQDGSTNSPKILKSGTFAGFSKQPDVAAPETIEDHTPRASGHSQTVPRITIQQATDATGVVSPLRTPDDTRDRSLSDKTLRGRTMSRRNSATQNPFSPERDTSSEYFPDTNKPTPSQRIISVDQLNSLVPFPEYEHDVEGTGGPSSPAPVVVKDKRGSYVLRKGRYLVLRSPVLQAMLGREIAGQAKPALAQLAHRTRDMDYPPVIPNTTPRTPAP